MFDSIEKEDRTGTDQWTIDSAVAFLIPVILLPIFVVWYSVWHVRWLTNYNREQQLLDSDRFKIYNHYVKNKKHTFEITQGSALCPQKKNHEILANFEAQQEAQIEKQIELENIEPE